MATGIERLRAAFRPGRPSVVAYLPVGDPSAFDARTPDAYRDAGVAVLEVGIPTRRPWLDGPEVTASMGRALDAGTDPATVGQGLAALRAAQARPGDGPALLWFSYPDLPLSAVEQAAAADALDGLMLLEPWRHPDAERIPSLLADLRVAACTFLPWTPSEDDLAAARRTTGYLMVQARPGVTGAETAAGVPTVGVRLARSLAPGRPVVVGFGVDDAASARSALGSGADGVVIGSAAIRALREGGPDGVRSFLADIVRAIGTP